MNNPTYFEALQWASLFIKKHHQDEYSGELLILDQHNWTHSELIMHYREAMPSAEWATFQKKVAEVGNGKPVQYVTNLASFYGRQFYVDERVLIPRMDTEELIETVLKDIQLPINSNVLDVGTGSGDIAITLKLEKPAWTLTAVDISRDALDVAQINAQSFKAKVDFRMGSLFEPVPNDKFDLIVSNPPYISENEIDVMDQSVIDNEPQIALFAKDDGLYWYKQIALQLKSHLKVGGYLVCEIGYKQGIRLQEFYQNNLPEARIQIKKDMSDNDRLLIVHL